MNAHGFMDDYRHRRSNDRNTRRSNELARAAAKGDFDGYVGLTARMAWRTAAALFAVTAFALTAQLVLHTYDFEIASELVIYAIGGGALGAAMVWWCFGERRVRERWLHVPLVLSYVMIAGVMRQVAPVEAHLGIAYLGPLMFAALFLSSRLLPHYIAVTVGFLTVSGIRHADEPFGLMPTLMTGAALVAMASVTLYMRLQLDRLGRQAAELSGRDALTGLSNLRPLYERVDQLIKQAERGEHGLAIIMIDLDGFKRVNDQYSHSVGDETLRAVAETLFETARRGELIARRGGDEFAIVSETSDPEEIESLIGRITTEISATRTRLLPDGPTGVTAGFTVYREGDTVGQLLARSDRMLHEAKAAARISRWSWSTDEYDG